MNYDDMSEAVRDANNTFRLADIAADRVARLLVGRLRRVSQADLYELKRELKNYNMKTGEWRD